MLSGGDPDRSIDHPVSVVDFNQVSPTRIFARGHANDPLTSALKVGGAIKATPRDFRILGADLELQVPLLAKDYGVRALAGRLSQVEGKYLYSEGIRLGPQASGEVWNQAKSVQCALPALRKAYGRQLMAVLLAPVKVGCPPATDSDASLGLASVGRQSHEVGNHRPSGWPVGAKARVGGWPAFASLAPLPELARGIDVTLPGEQKRATAPAEPRPSMCLCCPPCLWEITRI